MSSSNTFYDLLVCVFAHFARKTSGNQIVTLVHVAEKFDDKDLLITTAVDKLTQFALLCPKVV